MYIFENYGSNYGSKRSETNRSNPIRAERNSVTTPKTVCVLRWALPSHGRGHWFNPSRAHHLLPLYNNDLRRCRRHREVRRHSQCDQIVTEIRPVPRRRHEFSDYPCGHSARSSQWYCVPKHPVRTTGGRLPEQARTHRYGADHGR